jgi:hypothetical protein
MLMQFLVVAYVWLWASLKRGEKAMGDPVNSSVDVALLRHCLAMAASAVGIATTTTSTAILQVRQSLVGTSQMPVAT